jgi:hypothetical protein
LRRNTTGNPGGQGKIQQEILGVAEKYSTARNPEGQREIQLAIMGIDGSKSNKPETPQWGEGGGH